ncbi:MAG TPA: phosphoribosyl-AMP cyclohydrolase [bacterium]|nr:phosphoribosyl-AMP cyclohydrolase [bacterium]HOL67861.1 phosphoribosyl-AMP cyclohydrolase [bacterium]HPP13251.1 phosphoribosyl-AMP cyclohydrolase [bacterium]
MKPEAVKKVRFNEKGLVPVVVQDQSGVVLMMAYMNEEALRLTMDTGRMHYYSRSRRKIWLKGESSGHFQYLKQLALDCDGDCLLAVVHQKGAACHEGYYSCFFRVFNQKEGDFTVRQKKLFDPERVYKL